jgi:hypothetical protein
MVALELTLRTSAARENSSAFSDVSEGLANAPANAHIRWSEVHRLTVLSQDTVGSCDFIDVLEEAVLRSRPVAITLRDGQSFIDEIVDVVTQGGADYAIFRTRGQLAVQEIASVTRDERVHVD